ncbi:MAG: DNA polymerase IV [Planctomycetes bacterium]|nr:DNA polymerase IV [Planctomycetota bacterium]
MPSPTTVLHVDMDAFYASIEERDDPRLSGRPVCVGGAPESRGVIASASYAARKFGVRSAMPSRQALALCPGLVLVPPDFDKYITASRQIMAIFLRYSPLVEPLSLDEAFLDVSGTERLFGTPVDIGRAIKRDILRETQLIASVGVAGSKFLAKLASDLSQPDGLRVIEPGEERAVLDPLPVSVIYGVGPRTAKRLAALGVRTVADLASLPREHVMVRFGASGAWIHDLAHGLDVRRVTPRRDEKSFSQERTFAEDESDRESLKKRLLEFSEELAYRLRSHGLKARTVTIKARYSDFKTVTRTKTLDSGTHLGVRIYAAARELFERVPVGALRLIGVLVSSLEDVRTPSQAQLFPAATLFPTPETREREREEKLERAQAGLDRLRAKFGARAVIPASLLGEVPTSPVPSSEPRVEFPLDEDSVEPTQRV